MKTIIILIGAQAEILHKVEQSEWAIAFVSLLSTIQVVIDTFKLVFVELAI